MKKLLVISLLLGLIFFFCGCSLLYEHQNNAVGPFNVGYSERLGKAFLATYNWDGSEEGMNIVLPESYNGIKITGLGGYTGTGVPDPFMIEPNEKARENLCPNATAWAHAGGKIAAEPESIHHLRFKLHINKQIEEIKNLSAGGFIIAQYIEDGQYKENVYVLTCYVTCDEENETFYSKDGKLYYKKDDTLVEDIVYEDFDIEKYNEQTKEDKRYLSPFVGLYTSSKQQELSDEALAEIVAKNLGVPDSANVEFEVSETFYWEAGGRDFKNVTFTENGEEVAYAAVDPFTGELLKSIYKYEILN